MNKPNKPTIAVTTTTTLAAAMPHSLTPTAPAATIYCPLCGGANQCAPASSGSFAVDCWCKTTAISAAALARARQQRESQPPKELGARNTAQLATSSDSRGDACLCPHCAVQP